jgi:hypothetical protein
LWRLGKSGRVLKAIQEGGFEPNSAEHEEAVIAMCDAGNPEEAQKYLTGLEESVHKLGPMIPSCLVQKYSLGENVDMAVSCVHEMLEK